jgi:hypothetical protein
MTPFAHAGANRNDEFRMTNGAGGCRGDDLNAVAGHTLRLVPSPIHRRRPLVDACGYPGESDLIRLKIMKWTLTMERAFSPCLDVAVSWGFAPGWYRDGPLALRISLVTPVYTRLHRFALVGTGLHLIFKKFPGGPGGAIGKGRQIKVNQGKSRLFCFCARRFRQLAKAMPGAPVGLRGLGDRQIYDTEFSFYEFGLAGRGLQVSDRTLCGRWSCRSQTCAPPELECVKTPMKSDAGRAMKLSASQGHRPGNLKVELQLGGELVVRAYGHHRTCNALPPSPRLRRDRLAKTMEAL